jgi:amidase
MDDPSLMSAVELTRALRRRDVSSRELLDLFLRRIETDGGGVNAVVTVDQESAIARAKAMDEALVRGEPIGPLCGLPMTVKDTIETAGLRTTAGARELAGHVPPSDADAVGRLRAAGAVVFGKTNTPPFAADYQTANPVFGRTNNPWDRTRTPGGSAGGAAAALAAGHTGLELGSDLAGSIRIPAANCGVCGLKPSYGLVPTRGHIPPPPGELAESDLATLGPLGRGHRPTRRRPGHRALSRGPHRNQHRTTHRGRGRPVRRPTGELSPARPRANHPQGPPGLPTSSAAKSDLTPPGSKGPLAAQSSRPKYFLRAVIA